MLTASRMVRLHIGPLGHMCTEAFQPERRWIMSAKLEDVSILTTFAFWITTKTLAALRVGIGSWVNAQTATGRSIPTPFPP